VGNTPHTATHRGRKCRVELKDGTVFIDQFIDRTSGKRVIFKNRTVRQGDIKAMSDYRLLQPISGHKRI